MVASVYMYKIEKNRTKAVLKDRMDMMDYSGIIISLFVETMFVETMFVETFL